MHTTKSVAGGDGSQSAVAAIAAEHSLPYACVPAGTRNHFALDLGVDRNDIVGALDAFVDGAERLVDLTDVNGRVFVNNVSLGIYAGAVRRPGYRNAKLRTLLGAVPRAPGPHATEAELSWVEPDGQLGEGNPTVLVSNNPYGLGRHAGSALRPRLDEGLLGILVLGEHPRHLPFLRPSQLWREWTAPSFTVEAGSPVSAGVDGEAVTLEAPLQFQTRPGAIRVRIARSHPGASVSPARPGR